MIIGPNINNDGLVLLLDPSNNKSLKYPQKIYDDSIWKDGQTGSIGIFSQYSSNNRRVVSTNPWGVI